MTCDGRMEGFKIECLRCLFNTIGFKLYQLSDVIQGMLLYFLIKGPTGGGGSVHESWTCFCWHL